MSIRASLVSWVMRHTVKKRMATFDDPADVRQQGGMPGAKLPQDVSVETVQAGSVGAEWVVPQGAAIGAALLYLHGGGYVFGGPDSHRGIAWRLARETGLRVLLVDYRLAPEHPYPAALEDATESYRWLLEQGYTGDRIIIAGDSAGGGLSVALMVNAKSVGLPMPKSAVLMSPWVDLAMTGSSMQTCAEQDAMLSPQAIGKFASLYLQGADPKSPLASPLFADLSGLPPTCVMVGSHEVLRSDAETLVERLEQAGSQAQLTVWPNMPHVFPVLAGIIPEGKQAIVEMGDFVRAHLNS